MVETEIAGVHPAVDRDESIIRGPLLNFVDRSGFHRGRNSSALTSLFAEGDVQSWTTGTPNAATRENGVDCFQGNDPQDIPQ